MKIKSPTQTCGKLGKEHSYLGHFRKQEHLQKGHNTNVSGFLGFGKKEDLFEKTQREMAARSAKGAPQAPVAPVSPTKEPSKRQKQLDEEIMKKSGY